MEDRKCDKCGETKDLHTSFHLQKNYKSKIHYYRNTCKACHNAQRKVYKAEFKLKYPERAEEQRQKKLITDRIYGKKHWAENAERFRPYHREYARRNKEKMQAYAKIHKAENREYYNGKMRERRLMLKEEGRCEVDNLTDKYIYIVLSRKGWTADQVTPSIIQMQREMIKVQRVLEHRVESKRRIYGK